MAQKELLKEKSRETKARNRGSGFRLFLNREFEHRRLLDPTYSLRRFARDLGEDPSALNRLMLGKVESGPRTIQKLGPILLLSLDEIDEFIVETLSRRRRKRQIAGIG